MLIAPPERVAAKWLSELRVDTGDPFFFDHPLDHVPGMLLVCGLLAFVRAVSGEKPGRSAPTGQPAGRISLSLAFGSFGEIDAPVALTASLATRAAFGTWRVRAAQGERAVCEGVIAMAEESRPGGRAPAGAVPSTVEPSTVEPSRADLVHRHRAENIVIGPAHQDDSALVAPVLPPPAGHFLSRPGAHRAELFIEAARQFATMLLIERAGAHGDGQFIWHTLAADLPHACDVDGRVALRAGTRRSRGHRRLFQFGVIPADGQGNASPGHTGTGHITIEASSMSMSAFSRFRAGRRNG
jgi:hypothetical protein